MDHPKPGLRYVDAGDLDNQQIRFDGMKVQGADGETLGDLDGFIIDKTSARPYYAVVDAGGWFRSKYFLLPIGHVGFTPGEQKLVADVTRDRVDRYPGFDRGEFHELSDDELHRMDEQVAATCASAARGTGDGQRFDTWSEYRSPGWWNSSFYRPDRADRMAQETGGVRR
jgi:hypothetical protein